MTIRRLGHESNLRFFVVGFELSGWRLVKNENREGFILIVDSIVVAMVGIFSLVSLDDSYRCQYPLDPYWPDVGIFNQKMNCKHVDYSWCDSCFLRCENVVSTPTLINCLMIFRRPFCLPFFHPHRKAGRSVASNTIRWSWTRWTKYFLCLSTFISWHCSIFSITANFAIIFFLSPMMFILSCWYMFPCFLETHFLQIKFHVMK